MLDETSFHVYHSVPSAEKGKTEVISQETMTGAGGEWKAAELSNEFLLGSNLKSAQLEFATPERRVFGGK